MDWKNMAEQFSSDSNEVPQRGRPHFLDDPNKHTKDANQWIDSAIKNASGHQDETPKNQKNQLGSLYDAATKEIPKDKLNLFYDAAMKELMRLGLRPDGTVKIPNNPTQALSQLEEGMPHFDDLKANLDGRRALTLSLAILNLKGQLLPLALLELYEQLRNGGGEKVGKELDGLLATAEGFGVKEVGGRTLGDFRSDALDEIRKSTAV